MKNNVIENNINKDLQLFLFEDFFTINDDKFYYSDYFDVLSVEDIYKELFPIFHFAKDLDDFLSIIEYRKKKNDSIININFNKNAGRSILLNNDIETFLVEELNLYSLTKGSVLDYYNRKTNNDYNYIKIFDKNTNFRIFIDNKEIGFISFYIDNKEKDLFIEYFTIYESYASQGFGKYILELLLEYYKPISISGDIINADDGYTYHFWESVNNNICKKNGINFNMIYN